MQTNATIEELFAPLIGQIVWAVEGGFGTFITMEFGNPHLAIDEPIVPRHSTSDRVRRRLTRRRVHPVGDWHLWVKTGDWKVTTVNGSTTSLDETENRWKEWLDDLSGQHLLSVNSPKSGWLTLYFDAGGSIEIWPSEIENDVWTLHTWEGDIVGCRPDGTIDVEPGE